MSGVAFVLFRELGPPPAEIYIEESFVVGMIAGEQAEVLVFCEFLRLMACVEPSMYHLASEVVRRSIQALEGKVKALHIHVIPDLIGFFPSWTSIL